MAAVVSKSPVLVRALAAALSCVAVSCWSGRSVPDQTGTGETDGYSLVWADYFDGPALDSEKWTCENNGFGGGNAELQYYLPDNVTVERDPADGRSCLVIEARREEHGGKSFTSGRVNTEGKFSFTYGKVEASIKLPPTADGLWPAFWLLGADIRSNPWPGCGEIDILEMGHSHGIAQGTQDRYFNGACHWGAYVDGRHPELAMHHTAEYSLQDGEYHLYTLYWDRDRISMYLDKDRHPDAEPYFTMETGRPEDGTGAFFHHDYNILLHLAVGGFFPGILDPAGITALDAGPARMYVDFVKVYQK